MQIPTTMIGPWTCWRNHSVKGSSKCGSVERIVGRVLGSRNLGGTANMTKVDGDDVIAKSFVANIKFGF